MPLDGLTLSFIARELQNTLLDGRIEKVTQPEKDMLVLLIRANGKTIGCCFQLRLLSRGFT